MKERSKQDKEGGINPTFERQKVGNPLLRVCDTLEVIIGREKREDRDTKTYPNRR